MNKKIIKQIIKNLPIYILYALPILIVLSIICIEIYVWITYGNKPIDEIPMWALWFMFRRR